MGAAAVAVEVAVVVGDAVWEREGSRVHVSITWSRTKHGLWGKWAVGGFDGVYCTDL